MFVLQGLKLYSESLVNVGIINHVLLNVCDPVTF